MFYCRPVSGTQHGCLSDLDLTNTPYEDDNINDCTEALQNGGCIKAGGAEVSDTLVSPS